MVTRITNWRVMSPGPYVRLCLWRSPWFECLFALLTVRNLDGRRLAEWDELSSGNQLHDHSFEYCVDFAIFFHNYNCIINELLTSPTRIVFFVFSFSCAYTWKHSHINIFFFSADTETSQKALELIHGYRLLGKPLVIEFGRERREEAGLQKGSTTWLPV